jgi:hypothetical protein
MRHDPANRVMSLSFRREPEEHATQMLEAGRRLTTSPAPASPWPAFGLAIGGGIVVGIVNEIYRQFVLPLFLDDTETVPLGIAVMQLLPALVLLLAVLVLLYRRSLRRRRAALVSRIQPGLIIDVEIFPHGLVSSNGPTTIEVEWAAVRAITSESGRLVLECESFALYIPERAFATPTAFADGSKEIRRLWREALRNERDTRMIDAGLD